MAQPQHVRNDAHLDKYAMFGLNPFYNPSFYEQYSWQDPRVRDKISDLAASEQANAVYPGASEIKTPRDFWKNSAGSGMAEFTNRNFVSQGTNFTIFLGRVGGAKYPFPLPGTPTDYAIDALYAGQGVSVPPGIKSLCTDISISCTMTMYPTPLSQKASTLSIFDQDMQARGGVRHL